MMTFLLVVHSLIAVALVTVILLQRSEGGALGIGGGGGGLMTARGAANLLTRATAILAGLFILTSIGLAFLAKIERGAPSEIDQLLQQGTTTTAPATPGQNAPTTPATPEQQPAQTLPNLPSVPVGD
ncbi:preprotein translocase subunit SecG [Pedomonas mirosovicensis]|uniref:preprotein translocase subunit SecG n=1 Tax=Pedomonas mirosovicensis TaxID=2908641 RepID=UPI00216A5350|nr:preprotein translocase subunit SecG [Pedomonas mirosovicensis]MCH8685383.1 preprotein translocase subunit SecG [Pedomonas mirosovicensis]